MVKKALCVFLFFYLIGKSFAESPPSQIELNGFQLGQFAETPKNQFGKEIFTKTTRDKWIYDVYRISKNSDTLMAFKFPPPDNDQMYSIQLYGTPSSEAERPFLGLNLGDGEEKVKMILGNPTEIKEFRDGNEKFTRLNYKGKNYSLELDKDGKLFSIQLFGYEGFPQKPKEQIAPIEPFKNAILEGNPEKLLGFLSPDFEIYFGKKTIFYQRSAKVELMENKELIDVLFGKNGVKAAFDEPSLEMIPEIRLRTLEENQTRVMTVWKFPKSEILKEVLFAFQGGEWRIFEISFRK